MGRGGGSEGAKTRWPRLLLVTQQGRARTATGAPAPGLLKGHLPSLLGQVRRSHHPPLKK